MSYSSKKTNFAVMKAFLIYIIGVMASISMFAQSVPLSLVDTRVGTAASVTKTAGVFGQGTEEYAHTLPAVLSPFGMNFWTPQTRATEQKGVCPYLYKDERIQGFRCSHWIVGGCTQDYGSFTVQPIDARAQRYMDIVYVADSLSSAFSHEEEVARPDYYSVSLKDFGVKAEMTATERCAIMRFTYENPDSAYMLITVNSDEGEGEVGVNKDGLIMGKNPAHRIYQGWGEPTGHAGYFVIECNTDVAFLGRIDDNTIWVQFKPAKEVVVKMANSFTGYDGAWKNLCSEITNFDFDSVRVALADTWNKKFGQVKISGEELSDDKLAKFYGAMYRSSFLPHKINDADGGYPKFASGELVNDNHLSDFHLQLSQYDYYDDFSMWDTYRAQHPLLTILEPQRDGEMMQSLVRKYEQGGWMPIFPCWNSYTAAMIGDHCVAAIADAYVKGIRNFDIVSAYEGMRKNAFEIPATYEEYKNGMGRRALDSYMKYGYIPLEDSVKEAFHQNEQTSRTLEYAFDDYALAQVAKTMAENSYLQERDLKRCGLSRSSLMADYKLLMKRSQNYKNVFDPKTGWANGRHAPEVLKGAFVTPKDTSYIKEPEKHPEAYSLTPTTFSTFITEGTPVHYSWYVPHDIQGLIRVMGGKKSFEAKLDSMFERGWYWHGNEPCHQIAYLYSAIGKINKTARVVRNILNTEYLNAPGGLSGNDDAGQMSAWYIFSSLGFYPLCPGTPYYYIGTPTFPRVDINLENGRTFTIIAHGLTDEPQDIKAIRLNGKPYTDSRISHFDIMKGGTLEFEF